MSQTRVVITGMGVVSPFGIGSERFWSALSTAESAQRSIQGFDATRYRSAAGGEVPIEVYQDSARREHCDNPAEDATYFATVAADEALTQAGLAASFEDERRVGAVLGTLCAGMRTLQPLCAACETGSETDLQTESGLASYQLHFLAERYNLTGPLSLVSTACSSTTDAIGYAFDLIRSGQCDICLAGGGDVLAEPVHAAFNGLQSITTTEPKPFDQSRDGFFIGEGAAILVLETLESAQQRQAPILAEVLGYGLSNTAFHLTATSQDGSAEGMAVQRALECAGISADQVDFVNCHGTGTRHNDASEIRAMNLVFGATAERVYVTSNKAAFGHCMGAAGALEAVSTVLSIQHQTVPPTINTGGDETELRSRLVMGAAQQVPIRIALSQSFGFGGACSCVVLARYEAASKQGVQQNA